jgi:chromate reductase, NAD(P)H dehydrogenase (quinone)
MSVDVPHEARLLTVCGSLQDRSANRAALEAASAVAVAAGATVDDFDRLADVPAFDADRAGAPLEVVDDWRRRVAAADVVLVAAPEYAGAVAGAVKNAFDWLVGGGELYRKPVAVLSAGTSGGLHARRMMAQTLTWQGAYVVAELGIASPRTKFDGAGRVTHEGTAAALASLTHALLAAPAMTATDLAERATSVVGSLDIDVAHVAPAA